MSEYKPNYLVHPGAVLSELIDSRNLDLQDLFSVSSVEESYWRDFLKGEFNVNDVVAQELEQFTGVDHQTWLNLQEFYEKQGKMR